MDKILGCSSQRRSSGINIKPASNLWHAPRLAETLGYPMNIYATINLQQLGCPPELVSARWCKVVLVAFQKWVTRPGKGAAWPAAPSTHAWALEDKGMGVHVHWAVHVPNGAFASFEENLSGWLKRCCGAVPYGSTVDIQDATAPKKLPYYFLKGAHPAVAAFYGCIHKPQGIIIGKRSGTSINVGASMKRELRSFGIYPQAQRRFFSGRTAA